MRVGNESLVMFIKNFSLFLNSVQVYKCNRLFVKYVQMTLKFPVIFVLFKILLFT